MDLIFYSYKSRLRQGWRVILAMSLLFYVAHSWRISQKCPHGHYYNDGCTACWCDTRTGLTKCERLLQCTRRVVVDQVKCPQGRIYKDSCGNDCSCYESTGAVFCNEKRKCPQEIVSVSTAVPMQTTTVAPITLPNLNGNNFIRRDGLAAAYVPSEERHASLPPLPIVSSSTYPPLRTANPVRRSTIFDQFSMSSTRRPQVRIPARSEELIIEPAIIIRKKGSNKASVVRNPSSATSVMLSSSRRGNGNKPATIILDKSDHHVSSYPTQQFSASSSVNPLTLYEKQLKTIMDIRRAYTQLLHSKVNFNFQIATGKNPATQNAVTANNMNFNNNQGLITSFGNSMSMDHPRRFDNFYDNSKILVTTPSPSVMVTNHDYKSPLKPFFWRREQIKNALKQFSPVPPLRQLVSYVSTSTESYLSQFLNNLNKKNKQQQTQLLSSPETTTSSPRTITPSLPTPYYPMNPYSTPESLLDHPYDDQYASISPIHEVYQNHNFKLVSTTPPPSINYKPYDTFPQHYSYNHPSHFDKSAGNHQDHTTQFPFMNELMQEIVRSEHHNFPTATPRSSPALTAVPTFQTPGPPYAEIDVVHPLSFLPPPEPEPATPTRRTFTMSTAASKLPTLPILLPRQNRPRPTVRVNLDKPIYLPNSPQFQLPQTPQQQAFLPQHQQPFLPQQQPFLPQQQPFLPQHQQPVFPQQQPPFPPQRQQPFLLQHQPFSPQQPTFFPQSQQNRRNHNVQQPFLNTRHFIPHLPRPTVSHQYQHRHHPIQRYPSHQFFIPTRPKQYRLVLKGRLKEAATRVDDGVPQFVSKIAHEFFKKPDIYVPKIRPGMPLTLEKVVLNHKEIVPKEVMFSQTPGVTPTKLRFSPQAHWKMRDDLSRQGILLNEPLNTALRDYARGDPNVMEMDAPIKALNTFETHTGMTMGTYSPELGYGSSATHGHGALQESQRYQPILLPSPTPPPHTTVSPPPSLDFQHQQELQHQLLLAQQHHHQQQQEQHLQNAPASSGSLNNENSFHIDPSDFNDFSEHTTSDAGDDVLPYELNIPGVKQVVVDKYMVHDPLDPSGGIQVFSTTTVDPPLEEAQNVDLSSILSNQPQPQYIQRQGMPVLTPTPPPAVLIRHHGAPSPSPPPALPAAAPSGNYFLTVINTTPKPLLSSTGAPTDFGNPFHISNAPTVVMTDSASGSTSVVSQIHEFLNDQMDFGARPQHNLYDMLFHSRTGISGHHNISNHRAGGYSREEAQQDDQLATPTNSREEEEDNDDVDTEKLATIFSTDYKHKYNRKPPEVIVIKVPHGHSDGPFPKVVERHRGQEIEIIGGRLHSSQNHSMSDSKEDIAPSKETSTHNPSEDDSEEALGAEIMSSAKKRKRNRKGNKRKRKRKKKKGRKNKNKGNRPTGGDTAEEPASKPGDLKDNGYGYGTDNTNDKTEATKNEKGSREADGIITTPIGEAEQKFQSELDWKSQLMANICDINPSSPLCLTYRSICLLMTSDD